MVLNRGAHRIDPDGMPVSYEGPYRRGLFLELFDKTFGNVIEGRCGNCGHELRLGTGYCWECSVNWSATSTGDGRRIIQVLDGPEDGAETVFTWSCGPTSIHRVGDQVLG
jgi:hypothetical protein